MKILVILGSTRPNRIGDKVAKWVIENAPKDTEITFELVDLRDFPLPFFNEPMSPAMSKGTYETPGAREWADKIGTGDGYIFVTPEYNHGYSAVMKNALDYVYQEWNKKPVAFVSYGGIAAGTRAVMQLTQIVRELQMVAVREGAHLPFVHTAFTDNGNNNDYHFPDLNPMFTSLVWWARTLKIARESTK